MLGMAGLSSTTARSLVPLPIPSICWSALSLLWARSVLERMLCRCALRAPLFGAQVVSAKAADLVEATRPPVAP
jgi:hypothetical protein